VLATEVIYCGDNKDVLPKYIPDESVDLVYIDPPFNTGRVYELFWGEEQERRAYEDRYGDPKQYIAWMKLRLEHLYRALKPTGTLYLHCDPTAGHYLKVFLDDLFGFPRFLSEVVWKRTSAHNTAKRYGPAHDTLLVYTKSPQYTWNPSYQAYDSDYIETFFDQVGPDGRRWKRSDLTGSGIRNGETGQPWRGIDVTKKGRHWGVPPAVLDQLDAAGKVHWPKKAGGMPRLKQYPEDLPGVPLQDIWTDIRPLHNLSQERMGYPTQKPLALLERLIRASSNEGDVLLDAFCGCGTSLEAAVRLKRRWIGIDSSPTACRVMADRLARRVHLKERADFRLIDMPRELSDLHGMPPWEFQNWAINALGGRPNKVKGPDLGIDGRLYAADHSKPLSTQRDLFGFIGAEWYPIQVKQRAKMGRPDIDAFETAMKRDGRSRGYVVAFDFTKDAEVEIRHAWERERLEIIPVRAADLLAEENAALGQPPAELSEAHRRRRAQVADARDAYRVPDYLPAPVSRRNGARAV
jgi:DNA modification methylase